MADAANIIIGGATVYNAPVGETPPADSVAYGTAWGGNWTDVGYTGAPVALISDITTLDIGGEQTTMTLARRKTEEKYALETVLKEITSSNLQLALGGTAATTAAGASQVGKDVLEVGNEAVMDERAWGFEGQYVDSDGDTFPVRLFVFRATSVMNGNLEFAKGSEAGISLRIDVLADTTKDAGKQAFKFERVTAAATS